MLGWDVWAWIVGMLMFVLVRYNFELSALRWTALLTYVALAILLQIVLGFWSQLYLGRSKIGSFAEASMLSLLVLGISGVLGVVFALTVDPFPNATGVFLPPLALILMAAGRWAFRGVYGSDRRRARQDDATPVIVYGAGEAGWEVARLVDTDRDAPYKIIGFVDDDRAKRFHRIRSYRVLGQGSDLTDLIRKHEAAEVILAIGRAEPKLIQEVADRTAAAAAKLIVVPPARERIGGVTLSGLREFDVVDLLGRRPIETDVAEVAGYITGKVVLITGAGGSIGSELARQVHELRPERLFLLDRDESALHATQLTIYGNGLLDTDETVLCDIRDEAALRRIFDLHQPDVVLHAAALKHLPMLERFPIEGWKTNVLGTLNVLKCAHRSGVDRFVNVSTDKAADATSVLGQTKRLAEQLTAWYARALNLDYVSVRFGNVLGSRGSVVHAFKAQIERGGPITVTDPEVTRYFMTIPEACQLVLQAGAIGQPGQVMVLDMGEPVRIRDVAERLIEVSHRHDIRIKYTGLRPGEKLHEVLLSDTERGLPSEHPLITQVSVPALSPEEIDPGTAESQGIRELLRSQSTCRDIRPDADDSTRLLEVQSSRSEVALATVSGSRE